MLKFGANDKLWLAFNNNDSNGDIGIGLGVVERAVRRRLPVLVALSVLLIPIRAADDYPGATWGRITSLRQAGWSSRS